MELVNSRRNVNVEKLKIFSEKAIKKYNIIGTPVFFIGDKETDMKAAKKSNIKFKYRSKKNFTYK